MAQTISSRIPVWRLTSTMLSPDRHRASLSTSPMLTAPPLGSPHRLATRAGFTAQVDISEGLGDSAGSTKKYDPRPDRAGCPSFSGAEPSAHWRRRLAEPGGKEEEAACGSAEAAGAGVALAAVDHDVGSGHPGGARGQQEGDHVGDLGELTQAAERELG